MNERKQGYQNKKESKQLTQPLHTYYTNPAQLYLPYGDAYKYAESFKQIKIYQIRKVLDGTKKALIVSETNFEEAKKKMFVLVAMCAYNAGRDKKIIPLYNFVKNNINEKTIQSVDDIKTFDQLITSIVAYYKEANK